ncbi:MAG: hypothetical protein KA955_09490, partial [Prevotella sp.]|nr:hypothetical protein [Prevotella sp.]
MGETFLTMDIESPNAISFDIGDNCSYRGDIFTLNYIPSVEKTASTDSRGDAFKYSSVKMNSVADELTRCRMLDIVPDDMNVVWTGLPEFSFYAQTVNDLARRLQANLDSLYKDAKKWTVTVNLANLVDYNGVLCSISGKTPIDSVMSISDKSCMEILAECWNTFRVTYIIRGRTISIAPTPIEVGATFGYGINHGLYGLQQQTKQDAQIITRLYVYGSTRNIGNHYYANLTGKGKGTIDSTVSSLETERLSFDAATEIIHDGTVNLTLGGNAHNIPMTASLDVANTVRDHIYDLRATEFPSWTVTKGDTNSVIRVDFSIIDKYIDVNIGSKLTIEFQGQTLYVPFTQKFTYSQVSSFVNFIHTRFVDADVSGGVVQQYWSIVNYVNGDTHLDFKCYATGPRSNAEITLNTITGLGVTPTLTEKGALYLDFKANSGGGRLETPTIDVNNTGLVASVFTSTYGLYPYGTMDDNLYYFTLDFAYGTKYYKESRTQNGITQYIVKFKVGDIEVNGYIELDDTHVVGIVYQTEPNSAAFYSAMQTSTYIYITSGLYLDLLSSEYVSYNETISGNLAVNRLMLPDFPLVHNSPNDVYLDSPNISKYGIRQGYVIFDGSDTSKPEIYPTIHQMTAKNVIDSGITLSLDSAEGTDMSAIRLDKIKGSIMPTDGTKDGNIPTSVDYNYNSWQTTFTIFLKDLGFDLSQISGDKYYYAASDKMSISMISGTCAGREFQIDSIKRNTDLGYLRYELVCERSQDTNINKVYPYDSYPVSAGDEFVILNCRLPKVYVDANSQKLKDYGEAYLAKNDKTKYTYSPKVDEIWMDKNPTIANSIKAGDIFDFSDADLDLNVKSFIHTLTIKVGDKSLPSYDITLDEEVESTTIQKIQNQINNISLATGVSTNITDVQQAIATYGNDYFVSKNNDDIVGGNISFKQDISVRGKSVLQSTSVADLKVGKDITVDGQAILNDVVANTGTFAGLLKASSATITGALSASTVSATTINATTFIGELVGNAATATKLQTPRNI